MKCVFAAFGMFAFLLAGAEISAQQERQQERPQLRQRADQQERVVRETTTSASELQGKLAAWLASCNDAEVQLGQLAVEKAENQQVKEFAQKMVDEHTQLLGQLEQFIPGGQGQTRGQTSATDPNRSRNPDQPAQPRVTDRPRDTAGQREGAARETVGSGGPHDELMQIAKKAGERKLQMTKSLLEEKQGAEFDMCFMGQQIFAHIGLLSELEAMQGSGTEEFQQLVTKARQSTDAHFKHAMDIAKSLDTESPERVTRRPEQP